MGRGFAHELILTACIRSCSGSRVPGEGSRRSLVQRPPAEQSGSLRGIVEAATAADTDVIVMGTRGLSDFGGLFLGSVTHRVLHLAEKPVIVVL